MTGIKFTKTHEWVKIEGDIAVIGITDPAQSELGDIVFVELRSAGDKIKSKDQFVTVESTKAAAEVYTPVSGEVVEINSELTDKPQLINESPYDKGWIAKVKMSDTNEISELMDEDSYNKFVEEESK